MSPSYVEGKVTQLRREFKLLVQLDEGLQLQRRLERLWGYQPLSQTIITSVYFDGPKLPLTQRAFETPDDTLKIRTKEYFPDLRATAGARVVLETKHERGGVTRKRRVWLQRARLTGAMHPQAGVLPLIRRGRLIPVLAVTYSRRVYQPEETWRVTFDTEVSFHEVSSAQALSAFALRRELLGPAVGQEGLVVVEVKHCGTTLPDALVELRGRGSNTPAFSKFRAGMSCLGVPRTQAS